MRKTCGTRAVCATALLLTLSVSVNADSASPSRSVIDGTFNAELTVTSLASAVPFYRDGLGLAAAPPRTPPPRPPGSPPAGPMPGGSGQLTGAIGGVPKIERLIVPGMSWQLELIEMTQIEHRALEPRRQDVGSATLVVFVRDLQTPLESLKKAGATVVTTNALPVRISTSQGPALAIALRDPDGFGIELRQLERVRESAAPADSNILGAGFSVTVADIHRTARYWRDLLNFDVKPPGAFVSDPADLKLLGTPGAQVRRTVATPPGNPLYWEFLEFKHSDQRKLAPRIQDPGNAAFIVLTNDLETLVTQLRASPDTHILTLGRTYVPRFGNGGAMFFQEPNGIFLEACKGC